MNYSLLQVIHIGNYTDIMVASNEVISGNIISSHLLYLCYSEHSGDR